MAPQPLSSVKPDAELGHWFCGESFAGAPAELCKIPLQIIANWSCVEAAVLTLAAARLRTDFEAVAAMLMAPRSSEAQTVAALAGIKHGMSQEELAFFEGFWRLAESSRKLRHKLAHHLWGYTETLPGHLLLLDPKYSFRLGTSLMSHEARETSFIMGETEEDPGEEPEVDLGQILTFSKNDLLRELRDSEEVKEVAQSLIPCLSPEYEKAPTERARYLSRFPRLQQAVELGTKGS